MCPKLTTVLYQTVFWFTGITQNESKSFLGTFPPMLQGNMVSFIICFGMPEAIILPCRAGLQKQSPDNIISVIKPIHTCTNGLFNVSQEINFLAYELNFHHLQQKEDLLTVKDGLIYNKNLQCICQMNNVQYHGR